MSGSEDKRKMIGMNGTDNVHEFRASGDASSCPDLWVRKLELMSDIFGVLATANTAASATAAWAFESSLVSILRSWPS